MQSRSRYFPAAGVLYLCFVIYGSLVPLEFRALPIREAIKRFTDIPYLDLGIISLADWVANILLFIPLSYIWLGILWKRFNIVSQLSSSALIMVLGAALSIGIEFTQLFFPARTVSINDIIAETSGSIIGILAWWMAGERLLYWMTQWDLERGTNNVGIKLLQAYLAFIFLYNVMPLDLTISPVELYHKWDDGRIILLPFGASFSDPYQSFYSLLTDIFIWIPVGFLLVWSGSKKTSSAIKLSVIYSLLIEIFQLLVYSRVSDVTDILLTIPGAAIGTWFAVRCGLNIHNVRVDKGWSRLNSQQIAALLFLSWCIVLTLVFWYPFNFRIDAEAFKYRLESMHWVPFYAYYYGSEYNALTEVIHKVLFFIPLGAIFRIFVSSLRYSSYMRLIEIGAFILIAIVAFSIEIGQLFLPNKNSDFTDFVLETIGGLIGYHGLKIIQAKIGGNILAKSFPKENPMIFEHRKFSDTPYNPVIKKTWFPLLAGITLLGSVAWPILHVSSVPYNLRELLNPSFPILGVFVMSICVFWTVGFPVEISYWLSKKKSNVQFYPLAILFHSIVAWVMVYFFAPLESIYDIVGSPILGLPWQWEITGRFIALFSSVSLTLTGVTFFVIVSVYKGSPSRGFASLIITSLSMYPILYWIVVTEAATDNLTELMAGGGTLTSALLLLGFLAMLIVSGSWLATRIHLGINYHNLVGIMLVILLYPIAYLFISYGTEDIIVKYDKVFSALQFLLSTERSNYLQGWDLLKRYLILHSSIIITVMLVQYTFIVKLVLIPRRGQLHT